MSTFWVQIELTQRCDLPARAIKFVWFTTLDSQNVCLVIQIHENSFYLPKNIYHLDLPNNVTLNYTLWCCVMMQGWWVDRRVRERERYSFWLVVCLHKIECRARVEFTHICCIKSLFTMWICACSAAADVSIFFLILLYIRSSLWSDSQHYLAETHPIRLIWDFDVHASKKRAKRVQVMKFKRLYRSVKLKVKSLVRWTSRKFIFGYLYETKARNSKFASSTPTRLKTQSPPVEINSRSSMIVIIYGKKVSWFYLFWTTTKTKHSDLFSY